MSHSILSGLDNLDTVFVGDSRDDDFQGGNFVRLRDVEAVVAEALLNPTDEQVDAIAERARRTLDTWVTGHEVRAVLAAAAGGDDE